jgi:virginiamycin B lyase
MSGKAFTALLAAATLMLALAGSASAVTITTFTLPNGSLGEQARPFYIAANPNGTLWYTDLRADAVGALNTDGAPVATISKYPPTSDLAFAPNGTLFWTTEFEGDGALASRKPNGTLAVEPESDTDETFAVGFNAAGEARFSAYNHDDSTYGICDPKGCYDGLETEATDLSTGPGNVLWAMQPFSDIVRKLQANGEATDVVVNLPAGTRPVRGVLGPDGNLWVAGSGTEATQNRIVRITGSEQQTSFLLPPGRGPQDITLGPDGALWFTEFSSNSIGRMTTAGEYSSCPLPNAAANPHPYGIVTGPDGNIWFTEREAGKVGRLSGGNCAPVLGGGGGTQLPAAQAPPAGGSTESPPVVSDLKISPAVFKPATSGPSVARKKSATAATISFQVSKKSNVTFGVEAKTRGHRVRGKCKVAKRANQGNPGCTLFVLVGNFFSSGQAGANSVAFSGRVGAKALSVGKYRLGASAKVGSGAAGDTAYKNFEVVAR